MSENNEELKKVIARRDEAIELYEDIYYYDEEMEQLLDPPKEVKDGK